jgi:hypothetical protein
MHCACTVLSSVTCPALKYFSTLSHKRHNFSKKKVIEHKMCFDFLYNCYWKHFPFEEKLSVIWSEKYIGLHPVKYRLFLSDFHQIWIFWTDFLKKIKCRFSWKFVQWEPSCSMRTDVHDEASSPFSQFKKGWKFLKGRGSSVGIETAYGLDGSGIESRWGEIFRTSPDRSWGPPSLLYNRCLVFPGGKVRPGRDADPSPLLVPRSKIE